MDITSAMLDSYSEAAKWVKLARRLEDLLFGFCTG
jgi:hypothetical protein